LSDGNAPNIGREDAASKLRLKLPFATMAYPGK